MSHTEHRRHGRAGHVAGGGRRAVGASSEESPGIAIRGSCDFQIRRVIGLTHVRHTLKYNFMLNWTRRLLALALLVASPLAAETRSLTILHSNDLHARLSPLENHNGGFAYLAAAIRRERANCHDCILERRRPGAGHTGFHHLSWPARLPDRQSAGFRRGHHRQPRFRLRMAAGAEFIEAAKYPMASCNLVNAEGRLFAKPYVILEVNHLRVAVIGAMTDSLNTLSTPKLLGEWHTLPVVAEARKYAAEVRPKSDLIVLLGHLTGGGGSTSAIGAGDSGPGDWASP